MTKFSLGAASTLWSSHTAPVVRIVSGKSYRVRSVPNVGIPGTQDLFKCEAIWSEIFIKCHIKFMDTLYIPIFSRNFKGIPKTM